MMRTTSRGLTLVWMVLVVATVLAGWLAQTHRGIHWAALLIVLIASAKIHLIMNHFMELRSAPVGWRIAMSAWLLVVTCVVTSGYWMPWL